MCPPYVEMKHQPERALIHSFRPQNDFLLKRRNGVLAREGIDTLNDLASKTLKYSGRNGAPARKGIDTIQPSRG